MQVTKKERIEFIDLAKGVCILLVVILHLIPSSTRLSDQLSLECLRMPLYFCLSGLFFKDYGGFGNLLIKKTNNILIPFLAWYGISYLVYYIGLYTIMSGFEVKHHYLDIIRGNPIYNGPIWFLLCLFWSSLIFDLINRVTKKWLWQFIGVVLCTIGGFLWNKTGLGNYLYIGTSLSCMPFYFMGYTLKRTLILASGNLSKNEYVILAICLMGFSLIACFPGIRSHYLFVTNEYISKGSVILTYVAGIMIVTAMMLICKKIRKIKYITYLGRYSIIVLVSHLLLGSPLDKIIEKTNIFGTNENLRHLTVFFIVLTMMTFVIPFCRRFLPYISAQKELITHEFLKKLFIRKKEKECKI